MAKSKGSFPQEVYLVVPRHGGPVQSASWSKQWAQRHKKMLLGDFVVVGPYVDATQLESASRRNDGPNEP